jgi:hypothetical protein
VRPQREMIILLMMSLPPLADRHCYGDCLANGPKGGPNGMAGGNVREVDTSFVIRTQRSVAIKPTSGGGQR